MMESPIPSGSTRQLLAATPKYGLEEMCWCGHRYDLHAGEPGDACIRYEKGQRCDCRQFVPVRREAEVRA